MFAWFYEKRNFCVKRLRQIRTRGARDGAPTFKFSLFLSSRHMCSVDGIEILSLSEVIKRMWRLLLLGIKYVRTIK